MRPLMLSCAFIVAVIFRANVLTQRPQPISPVSFLPFADGDNWMVNTDLSYQVGDTAFKIVVPTGFVTDFASVPQAFWTYLPRTGTYELAAVVHDFLYWDQGCTREQADQLLLAAMIESRVDRAKRDIIYEAVRHGGNGAWSGNAAEKAAGKPRVIPLAFRQIPALTNWSDYREQLVAAGVKPDPTPTTAPTYCTAARSVTGH